MPSADIHYFKDVRHVDFPFRGAFDKDGGCRRVIGITDTPGLTGAKLQGSYFSKGTSQLSPLAKFNSGVHRQSDAAAGVPDSADSADQRIWACRDGDYPTMQGHLICAVCMYVCLILQSRLRVPGTRNVTRARCLVGGVLWDSGPGSVRRILRSIRAYIPGEVLAGLGVLTLFCQCLTALPSDFIGSTAGNRG